MYHWNFALNQVAPTVQHSHLPTVQHETNIFQLNEESRVSGKMEPEKVEPERERVRLPTNQCLDRSFYRLSTYMRFFQCARSSLLTSDCEHLNCLLVLIISGLQPVATSFINTTDFTMSETMWGLKILGLLLVLLWHFKLKFLSFSRNQWKHSGSIRKRKCLKLEMKSSIQFLSGFLRAFSPTFLFQAYIQSFPSCA